MRFRFDDAEMGLLRAAERVHGAALARAGRPDTLRAALALAKAGRKVAAAAAGEAVVLTGGETALLTEALARAATDVQWVGEQGEGAPSILAEADRRAAVLEAFPARAQHGTWRAFGLRRDLEALLARLRP